MSESAAKNLPGFEGCEKRLEVIFARGTDLRTISRETLVLILSDIKCTIISEKRTDAFDAYLLSESSCFIYPHKIIIKTCGVTCTLNCLPRLLSAAREIGTEPEFVQFSRANFLFPEYQPHPHQSFDAETMYLNEFFPNGHAYILGAMNGDKWHLYTADLRVDERAQVPEHTLEIAMFNLDREKMNQFYHAHSDPEHANAAERPITGKEATEKAGIDKLIPGSMVDDFLFVPQGYSCNGLLDDVYFTIHITPEPHCSFVSFETNVKKDNYTALVQAVLEVFKPGQFCVALFMDETDSAAAVNWRFDNYSCRGRTSHHFEGGYNVTCGQFVTGGSNGMVRSASMTSLLDKEEIKKRDTLSLKLKDDKHHLAADDSSSSCSAREDTSSDCAASDTIDRVKEKCGDLLDDSPL